jgi:hypothetical protein
MGIFKKNFCHFCNVKLCVGWMKKAEVLIFFWKSFYRVAECLIYAEQGFYIILSLKKLRRLRRGFEA